MFRLRLHRSALRRAGVHVRAWWLVSSLTLGLGHEALAQGNYKPAPTGGRSTLMGGTGVALSSDGTGPFLNPATMTRITDSRVAFSVNMYSFGFSKAGGWFQPGPVDEKRFGNLPSADVSTTYVQFSALPSTFCLFFFSHTGEMAFTKHPDAPKKPEVNEKDDTAPPPAQRAESPRQLSFCFATTEQNAFNTSDTNVRGAGSVMARQAQSVQEYWNRYAIGPSYASRITEHWSLGVSLHGYGNVYHGTWAG